MSKKIISFLSAAVMACSFLPCAAAQTVEPPVLQGAAACLMDAATGQILFEKNMDERRAPASITKIMTLMLGVESGSWTDTVTMSHDAVFSVPRNTSHIALQEGEQLTLEQALMATMLPSANDAANGVAEFAAGSIAAFVEQMNQRAAECGAMNTHFVNANGLDDPDHYTTARDMALITRQAMQSEEFLRVFGTAEYVIPPTNKQEEARNIGAGHKMLFDFTKYYDAGIVGGKSGYTPEAGHTLVTAVKRDDSTLIAVVLGEPKNAAMYEDTVALFDYGFCSFAPVTLTAEGLAEESDHPLLQESEPLTLYLASGFDETSIQKQYTIKESDPSCVKVGVDLTLAGAEGVQYADLGCTELVYEAETLAAQMPEEQVPLDATAKNADKPFLIRALLMVGRVAMVGICLVLFGTVMLMFYIRVSYDLRRKRRRGAQKRPRRR